MMASKHIRQCVILGKQACRVLVRPAVYSIAIESDQTMKMKNPNVDVNGLTYNSSGKRLHPWTLLQDIQGRRPALSAQQPLVRSRDQQIQDRQKGPAVEEPELSKSCKDSKDWWVLS